MSNDFFIIKKKNNHGNFRFQKVFSAETEVNFPPALTDSRI